MMDVYEIENECEKVIRIYKNGESNSKEYTKITLKQGIKFQDIQNKVSKELNIGYIQNFRLFNREGVEIFENDLQFLRNNYILLASGGEDYDSSTGFAEYEMLKVIGEGGFGKVLLGEHKITQEKVAIKFVNTSLIGNASDIDMVFHEAEVLKNLQHVNIVKIFNCYTLKGMEVVFIMEYLQGGELLEYVMKKGRLSEAEARQFFRQIVDAIQYCHKQNVIHRDLKLENILLSQSSSNVIKIIDFGIAKVGSMNTSKLNVGSLRYMAPEVLSNTVTFITKSIDIWSLGVILYTLVCGNLPFNGESPQEIMKNIITGGFVFPPILDDYLTPEIKELINLILVKDPVTRYTIKDIKAHPWMILPASYLQTAQDLFLEKQAQLSQEKGRKMTRGRNQYAMAGMREPTGMRGMNYGGNRMREPTGMASAAKLREPTGMNAARSMREPTGMNGARSMREPTGMSSMREGTRNGGVNDSNRTGSMRGGATTGTMAAKRQSKQVINNKPSPSSALAASKQLAEQEKDYEHIISNTIDDQINEIKAVLGLANAPIIPVNRASLAPQAIAQVAAGTAPPPPPPLQPLPNNLGKELSSGAVVVIPSALRDPTASRDLDKQKVKVVKLTNTSETQPSSLNTNNTPILPLIKSPTQTIAQRMNKSFIRPQERESVLSTGVSVGSIVAMGDSTLRVSSAGGNKAEMKKVSDQVEKDTGLEVKQINLGKPDRLVYILRRRRLINEQGDPDLQINNDFVGIYKPQQIGFIQFTSGTNLRATDLSPPRQSNRISSLSPNRKRQLSPTQNATPQNAIEANAFLARNTFASKFSTWPLHSSPS